MHCPLKPEVSGGVNLAISCSMSIKGSGSSADEPESQLAQKKEAPERNNFPRIQRTFVNMSFS